MLQSGWTSYNNYPYTSAKCQYQAHGQLNRWKVETSRDTGVAFWTEENSDHSDQLATIEEVSRLGVFISQLVSGTKG